VYEYADIKIGTTVLPTTDAVLRAHFKTLNPLVKQLSTQLPISHVWPSRGNYYEALSFFENNNLVVWLEFPDNGPFCYISERLTDRSVEPVITFNLYEAAVE
jgi:hypothetical protein